MKKFIETIKNIYNIEELRKRIAYTILLVLVYRLGSFILLPAHTCFKPSNMNQLPKIPRSTPNDPDPQQKIRDPVSRDSITQTPFIAYKSLINKPA